MDQELFGGLDWRSLIWTAVDLKKPTHSMKKAQCYLNYWDEGLRRVIPRRFTLSAGPGF
jgi:hypothetical protein